MFDNSSIMILTSNSNQNEVFHIELDGQTQNEICLCFSNAKNELITGKSQVVFDGSYKPHNDEFLSIENFQIVDEIKDAIRDPLGVPSYEKNNGVFPDIKAFFVGERSEQNGNETFNIAFQRFRKEQYISTKWYNLFFDENTFFQEKRFGFSISDSIDCFFTNDELQFVSFYFARQIFDLSNYYRSATDQEVDSFVSSTKLSFENNGSFKGIANTWIRRKIAMINDSNVLENYTAAEIKRRASAIGVTIETENRKVKIPDDKEKIKIILGFLDEEAYKGPFSQNTYLANSKRTIN